MGPFGFLSLNDATKNLGIEDQMIAIEFISQNAENIGGDNEKITIIGQGAGSLSLDLLLKTKTRKFIANTIKVFDTERFTVDNAQSDNKNLKDEELLELCKNSLNLQGCDLMTRENLIRRIRNGPETILDSLGLLLKSIFWKIFYQI